jgi:ATP-dependent DNA helicase RecG
MREREIDKILLQIEEHIKSGTFANVETDKFELKDLSTGGDWRELYRSACAFLNTRGGILVVGVKEDQQKTQFRFTGFQAGNENNIKQLPFQFTNDDGKKMDLSEYIRPDLVELKPFLNGQVCLIFVEKLPDEEKYVYYNNEAYERRITGDHRIPDDKIQKQKELKQELKNATELDFVPNTTIEDLDVDKLNDYIIRLNNDIKVETVKADILSALSFMNRKKNDSQRQSNIIRHFGMREIPI